MGSARAGHARPLRGGEGETGAGRERRGRDESLPYKQPEGLRQICRGRRPRRPAEGSRPLPTMRKIRGWLWKVRGPGMPGPYGVVEG